MTDLNTPPVPPTDSFRYPSEDAKQGVQTLERGVTDCPCGGRVDLERVFSGQTVVYSWDEETFSDEFDLEYTEDDFHDRQQCQNCGFGVEL